MNKQELSKRLNISLKTYYNWEKTKPELIKVIELGLIKEKELDNDSSENENIGSIVKNIYLEMQDMKKKIELLER